jgi:transcriptional regulator with GAF, ATPase, and Fis domain
MRVAQRSLERAAEIVATFTHERGTQDHMTSSAERSSQLDCEPQPHAGLAIVHDRTEGRGAVVSLGGVARIAFGRGARPAAQASGSSTRRAFDRVGESADCDAPEALAADRVVAAGALERMDHIVDRVAHSLINVLIRGETGAGKEVLARRIHERSPRAGRMVSINCAALSESLLESELFGHEMGAFTGALKRKVGLLESADGGTVFLDEIGEMPLATQAKLLRALEQREVTRVGALRPVPIDARFVAATNRHVEEDVAAGRFRADLYFRINGITLTLPPLRERVDEIEPLARAFAEDVSRQMGLSSAPRLSAESLTVLHRWRWPGNIRELRNVIQRAVLLCGDDTVITPAHLIIDDIGPSLPVPPRAQHPVAVPPPIGSPARAAAGIEDERERVVVALQQCAGNQAHAAKLLGISRGTLIKRVVDFGLPRPRKRPRLERV